MKKTLAITGILFAFAVSAQGPVDGFFKKKNQLDVAASATYAFSEIYLAGNGAINYSRNQTILSGFATYGVSDRLNVIGSVPIINFLPQDATFFAKYQLVKSPLTVAPAFGISFPMWNYNTESGQAIGQRAVTLQPKLLVQYQPFQNWIIQAQGGYNYAFDPVPSSYVYSTKIGFFKNGWYTDLWYDVQTGIGGLDYGGGEAVTSFRGLGVSYQRVGGVVYKHGKGKTGYFINGFTTLSGRNFSKFTTVGAGVVWKWE